MTQYRILIVCVEAGVADNLYSLRVAECSDEARWSQRSSAVDYSNHGQDAVFYTSHTTRRNRRKSSDRMDYFPTVLYDSELYFFLIQKTVTLLLQCNTEITYDFIQCSYNMNCADFHYQKVTYLFRN